MPIYWLILGILTVWRITHLLQAEDGPWNIIVRLRRSLGQSFLGTLLDCFYCLSLWIALPLAFVLGEDWRHRLLLWPSLSAGAILLERLTHHLRPLPPQSPPPATYTEDAEPERKA